MIQGIQTELRPISMDDFKRTYEWRNDEEIARLEAADWLYRHSHVPLARIEKAYEEILKLDAREMGEFAIYTKEETPVHIGMIGYRDVHLVSRKCAVGIGIGDKRYWGNGYGTDAMKALLHYLFQTMNMHRVQLDTFSGNERAVQSYKKCGFVEEGRRREDVYCDGMYYDTVMMGVLRKDFVALDYTPQKAITTV
ncbi:GNAT family acetyltransferase [Fictibacillus macauensis ZFHKF-1]|uniref:GNAT family acetyltransferase n=1 Tax=Fictibacillus macauensis ZFHKF-1 TaxID=1196324 RepID=I8UH12_9BACL|nr:GNAT family protein [Fictibacillus macauensis]EIT86190.1 GNAT family acetyltransferase [Fictibacillus macauensis ZFHKF-1]